MSNLLHTSGLTVGYRSKTLITGVDIELRAGELVALIGLNGSGKSTLLRTLCGLLPPLAGTVQVNGTDLRSMDGRTRARSLSVVLTGKPQAGLLDVRTLVSLGRQPWTGSLGRMSELDHARVQEALECTGTLSLAERAWGTLSDGEGQKVMIARALAQEAPVMILDEPTAFLDLVNRVAVMQLLRELAHSLGRGVLLSTHDLASALRSCDRIFLVHEGRVWSGTPEQAITSKVLDRAFASQGLHFDPVSGSLLGEV